jgi:hypothetical protein
MFLYFHRKYNMILSILKIFDYIQIKTLFFFFIIFFSYIHIYMLPITKIQLKTNNTAHK